MSYGFTITQHHNNHNSNNIKHCRPSHSGRRWNIRSSPTQRQIEGCFNIRHSSSTGSINEIRIQQHQLYAVDVERENDTQSATSSESSTGSAVNNFDGSSNIYELLGIEEGKLALGVKPEEVYKYIGTYVT
jgi:hypothetical protein